jgi:hypothetical protein
VNTTIDPDDIPGRGPGDPAAGSGATGTGPVTGDVRGTTPPPPPPVDPTGAGSYGAGAGPTGPGWSPSPGGEYRSTDRRSLLLGVAGGAGGAVVLGALLFALWPDRGADPSPGAAATPTSSVTSEAPTPTPTGPQVTLVDRVLPATQVWTPMGVTCATGDVLSIAMAGSASHDQTTSGIVGPTGLLDPHFHQFNVEGFADANTMTVIGSLGEDPATFFVVGAGATYVCPHDGELYLGVNDRGVQNNSGGFLASITRTAHG